MPDKHEDILESIRSALTAAEQDGYERGLAVGIAKLHRIALVVPRSVTKEQLIQMAANDANAMLRSYSSESG